LMMGLAVLQASVLSSAFTLDGTKGEA
jgi:hypothetical protein